MKTLICWVLSIYLSCTDFHGQSLSFGSVPPKRHSCDTAEEGKSRSFGWKINIKFYFSIIILLTRSCILNRGYIAPKLKIGSWGVKKNQVLWLKSEWKEDVTMKKKGHWDAMMSALKMKGGENELRNMDRLQNPEKARQQILPWSFQKGRQPCRHLDF